MKRILYATMMIVIMAFASSCKKDYTCTCTTTDSAGNTATSEITMHESKKDAVDACSEQSHSHHSSGTGTTHCELN